MPETTAPQVPNQAVQKQLTLMLSRDKSEKGLADRQTDRYCIAQNSGGEKLWRINNFQLLARKTLANARSFSIDWGKTLANRICLRLSSTDNENPQSIIIRTHDRVRCTRSQWIVSLEVIMNIRIFGTLI